MTPSALDETATGAENPGLLQIFLAFSGMAIVGFGGVLPWTRRALVEKHKWLTPDEFAELFSLSQFLPGGNIINLSIAVGQRFRGAAGAVAAVTGMLAAPTLIVITLSALFVRFGQLPVVHDALAGVTASAAGLILAMAAKMAAPLFRRGAGMGLLFAGVAFGAVAIGGFPLPAVLLAVAPVSVAYAWWKGP
jgi:chromate transporter